MNFKVFCLKKNRHLEASSVKTFLSSYADGKTLFWVDIAQPDPEALRELLSPLQLHPLVLEGVHLGHDKARLLGGGRGATVKISLDGEDAILRRYYRGGMVGKLLTDQYFWLGKSASRPWREWHILERAWQAGLPVPKPIAACLCRTLWWYQAAIITGRWLDC